MSFLGGSARRHFYWLGLHLFVVIFVVYAVIKLVMFLFVHAIVLVVVAQIFLGL